MEEKKVKMYTNSKGESIPITSLEFTHLSNALAKAYRDSFNAKSKDEYKKYIDKIDDLKEEIHRRMNMFYEKLGD